MSPVARLQNFISMEMNWQETLSVTLLNRYSVMT